MKKHKMVMETFKFESGMVATFGHDLKQIPELQGPYTPELHEAIKARSGELTVWTGYEGV